MPPHRQRHRLIARHLAHHGRAAATMSSAERNPRAAASRLSASLSLLSTFRLHLLAGNILDAVADAIPLDTNMLNFLRQRHVAP
jgi:hypothetical protein